MEKRCSKCGGTGPFTRDRSKPDGLYSSCKKCRKVYSNLPDNRERNRSQAKDWREANPEMARAGADAWRKSNLVKVKARLTIYASENKDKFRQYSRNFEKARRSFVNTLKHGLPCLDCNRSYPAHCMDFDHVRGVKVASISRMLSKYSRLPDNIIAEQFGKHPEVVRRKRTQLGIPIYIRPMPEPLGVHLVRPWHELAGTMLDKDVAKIFDISKSAVSWYRKRMGILAFKYRDAA